MWTFQGAKMRMRYVLFLSLILPLSTGAYASIFQSVSLIKWPWPDKEFALLLRKDKVNEMIAKDQRPDPFEESWEGSVHILIYVVCISICNFFTIYEFNL